MFERVSITERRAPSANLANAEAFEIRRRTNPTLDAAAFRPETARDENVAARGGRRPQITAEADYGRPEETPALLGHPLSSNEHEPLAVTGPA